MKKVNKLRSGIITISAAAVIFATLAIPVASMSIVHALSGPYVTLNSFSGHPASVITVSGGSFGLNEIVNITAVENGQLIASTVTQANKNGEFSVSLTLPTKLTQGNITITAIGQTSKVSSSNGYYVAPFTPALTVSSGSTTPYAPLSVSGSGYAASETVDLTFAGSTTTAKADSMGNFAAMTITTPNAPAASYTLVGTGEASGASASSYEYINGFYASASPTSYYVLPATSLGFNGSGFAAGETITVTDADNLAVLSSFKADSKGGFANGGVFTVPTSYAGHNKKFVLTGNLSTATATISSTIGKYFPNVSPSVYYVMPGNSVSFNGSGFVPGEIVDVTNGTTKLSTTTADSKGNLKLAGGVVIPATISGTTQTYTLIGETSHGSGSASIQIGSYSPHASPSTYYASPGSTVTFAGSGYALQEVVTILSGVKSVGSFTTDIDGTFTGAGPQFIDYNQANTTASYSLLGSVSKTPQLISFGVGQMLTQITPSSYHVLPYVPFTVTISGFAPNEVVNLMNGTVQIATVTTNKLGTGTFTNVTLPATSGSSVKLIATGVTSRAKATVNIGIGSYTPSISSSDYYVKPGTVVTLKGSGFAPSEVITIIAGKTVVSTTAGATGVITVPFTVPFGQTKSVINVTATGNLSTATTTMALTLAPFTPQVSPSTYYATSGADVTFTGSGFAASETIAVSLNGASIGSETAGALGVFTSKAYILPFDKVAKYSFTGMISGVTNVVSVGLAQFYTGIQLDSYYGTGGRNVTVSGSGFAPNESVVLTSGSITLGTIKADKAGAFLKLVTIPYVAPGKVIVTATGATSNATDSTSYTVATVYNSVQLGSYAVPAGKPVNFIGSGYFAGEPIVVTTDRTVGSAGFTASKNGTFNDSSYVLPANLTPGMLTLTITGTYSFTAHKITVYVQPA